MSDKPKKPDMPGLPPWMATFADMMALMMTFFVLLFAFSEVEQEKFKQMAGSMAQAFGGVQYIKSNSQDNVKGMEPGVVSKTGFSPLQLDPKSGRIVSQPLQANAAQKDRKNKTHQLMQALKDAMAKEIARGDLMLERDSRDIVIRFPEHVSFASGSAYLVPKAIPLIQRILGHIPDNQMIIVGGHTDNRPVAGGAYKSNWDLSAARAASVAEQVLLQGGIDPTRLVVAGYADTRPIEPNDTAEHRTRNRRVEIIIKHVDDYGAPTSMHPHVVVE